MKKITLFFGFLLICLVSQAGPVSRSQALQEAKCFLATKGVEMKSLEVAHRAPRKANAQESESSYYYVFNAGNDQGFVIVSGDDRTEKILGYSDSGSFDEENMPEPLKAWLEGYEREIESLVDVDVDEDELSSLAPRRVQEKTKKSIAPLTTAMYGSGYPYVTKLNRAAVGCTPVAVSILLAYYKSELAKITSTYGSKVDWNNLLDDYYDLPTKNYTTAQLNAVTNLMYYTATALGTSSAGATSIPNILKGLKNYFAFNDKMALVSRSYFDVQDWDNIIHNELICERPVLYNAFNSDHSVGHTFVVDGYDSSGLFHINWGWDGMYNGFFRLSVLTREESGYSGRVKSKDRFCMPLDHTIVLYAVPYKGVNSSHNILSASFTSASGSTVSCVYKNESGVSGSYLYGLGYVKDDDVLLLKQYSNTNSTINDLSQLTRSISLTPSDFSSIGIPYGTHRLVPVYKLSGENKWDICQYNKEKYVKATYVSNSVSLAINTNDTLSASSFYLEGNGLKNKVQRINTTITNKSRFFGYSGNVYLFASTTNTKGSSIASVIINLGKDDSVVANFPFTPSASGTYNLWVSTDSKGSHVIGQSTIKILAGTEPILDISGVGFNIKKNYAGMINGKRSIWGSTYDLEITGIKNNGSYPISTVFNAWLRQYDNVSATSWNATRFGEKGDNGIFKKINVVIPAKSTISVPILFENVAVNNRYDLRLEFNKEETGSNSKIIVVLPMVFLPAVTTWKADGTSTSVAPTATVKIGADVVAVDITDATTVTKITPNSNSNILYYLGASQKVPSGLVGKNVVKGNVAETVTLVDGMDFFVPKRFTAKKIDFTIIPKEGVSRGNNNHWNTIALPFDVTSVKNTTDNIDIDWFHSDDDTGKNFWIRRFDKLDTSDNTVIFENADQMLAYEPYIMNVPDDYWGKKWDLRGKLITFHGENAILDNRANIGTNSSYYNFVGTTVKKTITDGWPLNNTGDTFKYYISGAKDVSNVIPAFHAYFVLSQDYLESFKSLPEKAPLRIKIAGDDGTATGILAPFAAEEKQVNVYNLNGVKVATKKLQNGSIDMSDLPKGIYIVNGKKFIQY